MLVVGRNKRNNLVVSISQHITIPSPSFLFGFTHIMSGEEVLFYPKLVEENARYYEFEFIDGKQPVGYTDDVPYVQFPYPGQYYYSVYEMVNTASTNPNYAVSVLEEGRCVVDDTTLPPNYPYVYTSSNESNKNYIYYKSGSNTERLIIALEHYIDNNGFSEFYSLSKVYPDLLITDLSRNYTYTSQSVLFDENLCGTGYVRVSGETQYLEVIPGQTEYRIHYNPNQVDAWGYSYGNGEGQNTISASTYTNLGVSSIVGTEKYISGTTTNYYINGTSSSFDDFQLFQTYNNLDPVPPKLVGFELIGNTTPCDTGTYYILSQDSEILMTEDDELIEFEH